MSDDVTVEIVSLGQSWRVTVAPLGSVFIFRNISMGKDPHAEVAVSHNGRSLWRSTSTLSLAGRDKMAKTAAEMDSGDGPAWRAATYAAVEAAIEAEESLGGGEDLRFVAPADPDTSMLIEGFFPSSNTALVMPNETGKSTVARALAMSIATGREMIPGLRPRISGPVMYVAGEDGFSSWHAKSLGELARGAGFSPRDMPNQIRIFPTKGRSLTQMARNISEQAGDYAAIFLDSHQALLGADQNNMRDRDSLFWNAIDQIETPTFTVAHPNREDRKNWKSADGSISGSDVNQDRIRCRWKGYWLDDDDKAMQIHRRRYTMQCRKWSHGEKFESVSFALEYTRDYVTHEWTLRCVSSRDVSRDDGIEVNHGGRPPSAYAETLQAYRAGATDATSLAAKLGISYHTAYRRLDRFGDQMKAEVQM